jgi:Acetyltransferase (GNAT) domain
VSLQFHIMPKPLAPLIEALSASDPTNPFYTAEYLNARLSLGEQPWFLGFRDEGTVTSGCMAFLSGSFLRRSLTIPSLPVVSDPAIFWRGVTDLCQKHSVWLLQADTYASARAEIPMLPGELARKARCEYVLDLEADNILGEVSTQHQRNISRASKAGLSIRRTHDASACAQHIELMSASMERRTERGETVDFSRDNTMPLALLASRSGELFQALQGDRVLSSILVLKARLGAYYQSAGTAPEGMKLGASPFLISQVAAVLKHEGVRVFNLGGASESSPGLSRFKAGFGARPVTLESASFCPKSAAERKIVAALRSCWTWVKQN